MMFDQELFMNVVDKAVQEVMGNSACCLGNATETGVSRDYSTVTAKIVTPYPTMLLEYLFEPIETRGESELFSRTAIEVVQYGVKPEKVFEVPVGEDIDRVVVVRCMFPPGELLKRYKKEMQLRRAAEEAAREDVHTVKHVVDGMTMTMTVSKRR